MDGVRRPGPGPVLQVENLSKTFASSRVLDRAALDVRGGEVHGLLGQNGSGKSTLIKILAGYHAPDPGGIVRANGSELSLPLHAGQSRELGWAFVHQDLGLFPGLRVLDNLNVSRFPCSSRWAIRWRAERAEARRVLRAFNVEIDPETPIADLSGAERAMVAIVRAAEEMDQAGGPRGGAGAGAGGLLVLDEPTVFLPKRESERLFALIRDVAARGAGVIFVSHQLSEVRKITDRVTVLRDGRVHGTVTTSDVHDDDLIELIVGRRLDELGDHHGHDVASAASVLEVRGLGGARVSDVGFTLRSGEVLGLTGLVGSGFEDVPYHLFGALRAHSGEAVVEGRMLSLPSVKPAVAMRHGLALVPGDRARSGGIGAFSLKTNMTLPSLGAYFNGFRIDNGRERSDVVRLLRQFDVRPPEPAMPFGQLSGGNQQKALVAKWLHTEPRIVLMHEPTQGIDVGSRRQIFELIAELAERGVATVCASSDYEQLEEVCDRVLVFRRGRIAAELHGPALTKERMAERSFREGAGEARGVA